MIYQRQLNKHVYKQLFYETVEELYNNNDILYSQQTGKIYLK